MKFIIILFVLGLTTSASAQNAWAVKDSVNGAPRSVSSAFTLEDEGYVIGGLDSDGFRRKMYSYTFWQDDWDDELSIGGLSGDGLERGSACAFAINDKGYVCLGQGATNPFFNDLWQYDPVSKTWSQKASFIGSPRRQAVAFVIDQIAYVGTGSDANGLQNDMYKYNPANNVWTQLNDFGGTARKEAVGFAMGGQGYIGTGDDGVMRNDFWQYQPSTDSWIQKTDFPGTARKGATGWGQFPSGFICLGEDINFLYRKDLWEYNYYSDSWVQRVNYPGDGRSNAIVFISNDLAFVGTGYNGQFYDDMYAYRRILGVEENDADLNVKIYPNPAREKVTIEMEKNDFELHIVSSDGKTVVPESSIEKTSKGYIVYRNGLVPGTYFAYFTNATSGKIHTEKIIFAQ